MRFDVSVIVRVHDRLANHPFYIPAPSDASHRQTAASELLSPRVYL